LHQAVPTSGLRALSEQDTTFGTPYWAYAWEGGLALARYLLDHPAVVANRRVLDLGSGSGLVAIAAALCAASDVVAADVDPYAIMMTSLNAEANNVLVQAHLADLAAADSLGPFDTILIGDLFYDADTAARLSAYLEEWQSRGAEILIGDPGRTFLPAGALQEVASYSLPGSAPKAGFIFKLR